MACNRVRNRRANAQAKAQRVDKLLGRILTARLYFETVHGHVQALLRACGGWSGLRDALSPADRAKLSLKLADVAEREQARVEELERRQADAEAEAQSPAMKRDLEQMALDWIRKHPTAAIRELTVTPAGKRAFRKAMKEEGQETP